MSERTKRATKWPVSKRGDLRVDRGSDDQRVEMRKKDHVLFFERKKKKAVWQSYEDWGALAM